MEKQMKKTMKIALIFLGIGLLLGTLIAFAATPTATIYIGSGNYPGAPSYTVWVEGSNYFAKDENGQILAGFSGTNASEIIQACHDDLSGGGSIYLQGEIHIEYQITITNDDIRLYGDGDGTVLHIDNDINMIYAYSNLAFPNTLNRLAIENLKIYAGNVYHTENAILLVNCSWTYINNVQFEACWTGINATLCHDVMFTDNHHYGFNKTGIILQSGAEHLISNGVFDVSQVAGSGDAYKHAIHIVGASGCLIEGNVIEHLYGAAADGIYCGGSANNIVGNQIRECDRFGLTLTSTVSRNNIVGNHISDNTNDGVACGGDNNSLTGNYFYSNGGYGIDLEATSINNSVRANYFRENTAGAIQEVGTNDIKSNYGFVTENRGITAAIATGTAVNHGLAGTPLSVVVTAAESGPTDVYVDTVGAASFKIHFGGGGNKIFYWYAEYKP